MAKYKVVKQINFGGYTANSIPLQNFAPKIGEEIELGELIPNPMIGIGVGFGYEWNFKTEGTKYKEYIPSETVSKITPLEQTWAIPSTATNQNITPVTSTPVPVNAPIADGVVNTPLTTTTLTSKKPLTKNIVIGLVIIGTLALVIWRGKLLKNFI